MAKIIQLHPKKSTYHFGGAAWFDLSYKAKGEKHNWKKFDKAFNIIKKALEDEGFSVGDKLYHMDWWKITNHDYSTQVMIAGAE